MFMTDARVLKLIISKFTKDLLTLVVTLFNRICYFTFTDKFYLQSLLIVNIIFFCIKKTMNNQNSYSYKKQKIFSFNIFFNYILI